MLKAAADKACYTGREVKDATWLLTRKFRLQELLKYGFELFIDPSTITWMFIISPISFINLFDC